MIGNRVAKGVVLSGVLRSYCIFGRRRFLAILGVIAVVVMIWWWRKEPPVDYASVMHGLYVPFFGVVRTVPLPAAGSPSGVPPPILSDPWQVDPPLARRRRRLEAEAASLSAAERQEENEEKAGRSSPSSSYSSSSLPPRNIWIDVGANCGNSYSLLRNGLPSSLGRGPLYVSRPHEYEVFLVEADPYLYSHFLRNLSAVETAAGRRTYAINAAIAGSREQEGIPSIDFFLDGVYPQNVPCGFRHYPTGAGNVMAPNSAGARAVTVPTLDVAAWIETHFREEDNVLLKLDIEGAERETLYKLTAEGTLRLIDVLLIEWDAGRGMEDPELDVFRKLMDRYGGHVMNWGAFM